MPPERRPPSVLSYGAPVPDAVCMPQNSRPECVPARYMCNELTAPLAERADAGLPRRRAPLDAACRRWLATFGLHSSSQKDLP